MSLLTVAGRQGSSQKRLTLERARAAWPFADRSPLSYGLLLTAILVPAAALSLGLGSLTAMASGSLLGLEAPLLAATVVGPVVVAFAVRRYHAAVFVAFTLFGVVQIEPAPVDALLALLLPLGLLNGALDHRRLSGSLSVHALVWTMVIVTWIAVTQAAEPVTSIRYTLITLYCIAIMYFVKMYVASAQQMGVIVSGYLVGALVAVVVVIGDVVSIVPDEVVLEQGRARGLFKDANVFGPFLVPALLICLDEAWRPKLLGWLRPGLRLAALALTLLGIFLTYSRATWGNAILTLGFYGYLNAGALTPRQRLRAIGGVSAVVVGLAGFAIAFDQVDFLSQRANVLQSYDSERFDAQRTGLELGLSNLVGIGPAMTDSGGLFAPHSLFIRAFAETGLIGLALLVTLLATLVVPTLRHRRAAVQVHGLSGSVLVAVALGQLVNGFLIDTLHWRHFWLVLGLLWVAHDRSATGPVASSSTEDRTSGPENDRRQQLTRSEP